MRNLTRGEQKSLAMHKAVAAKVRAQPFLLSKARERLQWLRNKNPAAVSYYDDWADLLDGNIETLLAAMVDPSEHACALRQENPFVDLVDQKERARIFREIAETLDREREHESRRP